MPAVYAHERFGKLVYQKLDSKLKKAICENKQLFEIGLQGPDFLFFYRFYKKDPVNQYGYDLHQQPVIDFLTHSAQIVEEKGMYSPEAVYIYGFLCHFTLDSECHWYVEDQVKETGVGHVEIESELEKAFLKKDRHYSLAYPVWNVIPTGRDVAECMAQFYPEVTVDEVQHALRYMRFCKRMLSAPSAGRRKVLESLMRLIGGYESMRQHILYPEQNKMCAKSVKRLMRLYEGALEVAPTLIAEYQEAVFEKEAWNPRFNRNFE